MNSSLEMTERQEMGLLLCLATMQFAHIVDFMLIMPLGPVLQKSLVMNAAEFGTLVSSYNISAALLGLVMAFFLDRLNRRRLILILFAGFIIATALSGMAWSYSTMLVSRFLVGACGGVLSAAVYSVVADVIPEMRRGAAMGTIVSAFSVASVLGIPFSLWLATNYHWRMPFFVLAGISVLIYFGVYRLVPDLAPMGAQRLGIREQIQRVIRPSVNRWSLSVTLFLVLSGFSLIPYISMSMVYNGGVLEEELPYMYLAGGVATLITSRLFGWLSDRYGRLPVFLILAIFSLGPALWLANFPPLGIAWASLAVALYMVFNSGRMIVATAMATIVVQPSIRGSFMSLNTCVQQMASSAGALIASRIVEQAPTTGRLLHMPTLGWFSAGMTLLGIFSFLKMHSLHTASRGFVPPLKHNEPQTGEASS